MTVHVRLSGELVQAQALDEHVRGIDERDGDLLIPHFAPRLARETCRCQQAGVACADNDDLFGLC